MRYMLDTDIASYVIRRRPESLLSRFADHADELCISVITEAELLYGVEKKSSKAIAEAVDQFLMRLTVLNWNRTAARMYAKFRTKLEVTGTPIGNMDLMIAAHAAAANLVVVTNNERHFSKISGLEFESWV